MTLSDPFNAEFKEAMATAPAGRLVYETVEFFHQNFAAPIRLVQDDSGSGDTINLGIEAEAIFNPGTMQPFTKTAFQAPQADFGVGRVPETTVTVDGVGRLLTPEIMAAVEIQATLTMIYRQYVSDILTAPSYGPVEYVISNIKIKGDTLSGLARIDNLSNKKFVNRVFTIKEYPSILP